MIAPQRDVAPDLVGGEEQLLVGAARGRFDLARDALELRHGAGIFAVDALGDLAHLALRLRGLQILGERGEYRLVRQRLAVPVRQRRMGAVEPAEGLLVHHALEGHDEQREQEGDDDEQEQRQHQRHRLQLARPLGAREPHLQRYAVDGQKGCGLRNGHAIEMPLVRVTGAGRESPAPSARSVEGYCASQALKRLVSSSLLSAQNTRSVAIAVFMLSGKVGRVGAMAGSTRPIASLCVGA